MRGTIVDRQIRRCNRNLFLVNAGIIALLFLSLIYAQRYLYNCVAGPFPVSAEELSLLYSSGGKQEYVSVIDNLQAFDTGVYVSHTTNGAETSRDHFLAARVDERLLLIKSGSATLSTHYDGGLSVVPADIRGLIQTELTKEGGGDFGTKFQPFMLDSTSYRSDAYVWFGIGLPLFGLCVWNLKKLFGRMEDVRLHPTYWALRRYGENVDEIATMLNADAAATGVKKYGAFTLTPTWLLHKTFFSFTPMHLTDLVWVYSKRTRHSTYFIPTGNSHAIVVGDTTGRMVTSDLGRGKSSEQRVEECVGILCDRVPWAIIGYNPQIEESYKKSLQNFVETVIERRKQHDAQNP